MMGNWQCCRTQDPGLREREILDATHKLYQLAFLPPWEVLDLTACKSMSRRHSINQRSTLIRCPVGQISPVRWLAFPLMAILHRRRNVSVPSTMTLASTTTVTTTRTNVTLRKNRLAHQTESCAAERPPTEVSRNRYVGRTCRRGRLDDHPTTPTPNHKISLRAPSLGRHSRVDSICQGIALIGQNL